MCRYIQSPFHCLAQADQGIFRPAGKTLHITERYAYCCAGGTAEYIAEYSVEKHRVNLI